MEVRGPSAGLDELIAQVTELDALAKRAQVDDDAEGKSAALALGAKYEIWYAECLSLLPGDLKQQFRTQYEGSLMFPRVKSFLHEPRRARVKFIGNWQKPPSQYNGRMGYWQHPYQRCFLEPVTEQKRILLETQARLGRPRAVTPRAEVKAETRDNSVFVIHGRDKKARREFYTFLRAIGLDPVEWAEVLGETGKGLPHIGEVLRTVMSKGRAIIVLSTPDDIVELKPEHADDEDDRDLRPTGQARPNVIFEAGMALALEPDRTLLVEFGKVRRFTDIDGYHAVRLDNSAEKRQLLAQRLQDIGCPVKRVGSDWLQAGDLTPPVSSAGGAEGDAVHVEHELGQLSLRNVRVNLDESIQGEVHNLGREARSALIRTFYYGLRKEILATVDGVLDDIAPECMRTFVLKPETDVSAYENFDAEILAEF
ncbi:TIR domain-containing protein [Nocardia sp. NRRL S-836]|uniref:TIR domain-containing protein n=1 Tax=Nocardia sp. NRRL S-836 TaxID=1519492 RepID=UPI0006AF1B97|nr:nucleotide-binding protein [Nocardia sp. NRRL S-836]